jgi:hypothetical protein
MFNSIIKSDNEMENENEIKNVSDTSASNKYKNVLTSNTSLFSNNEMTSSNIDEMLEKEKQHNKTETWNKLDKTVKIQKLHIFSEKYGKDNNLSVKEIKTLKLFFSDCLTKNKLQKKKDINYDKDTCEIISIPSLFFNNINRNFTLKIMDVKRISTLKSLTPKRISEKNKIEEEISEL